MTELRAEKLQAHQRFIVLIMRAGLKDKIWWNFGNLAKQMAVSEQYISMLTKGMRETGVLVEKEKGTKPILLKLNTTLAKPLPDLEYSMKHFGPISQVQCVVAGNILERDNISAAKFFDRALEAYEEKRKRILEEW